MTNKLNLQKMSETTITLSSKQWNIFANLIGRIQKLETTMENNTKIKSSIFLDALLEYEAVDSSRIEGTQTQYDEIFYDIEGIDDVYSWETRNLINIYKEVFIRLENNNMRFNIERLQRMHEKLYSPKIGKKWKLNFNPKPIINKIRPGKIITNDQIPNWIGPSGLGIDKATLIPVKPSEKISWLEDIFQTISQKEIQKEWLITFHPIFESIHPFSDGNGRLGRMLLTSLFKYFGITQNNWLFFSDIIYVNKDAYLANLYSVQTTGNWQQWIDYYLTLLKQVITKRERQILSILELFVDIKTKLKIESSELNTSKEGIVLKSFFKFPRLNKQKTILHLINKYKIPQASAYRAFEKIRQIINAKKYNSNQYEFTKLLNIIKDIN